MIVDEPSYMATINRDRTHPTRQTAYRPISIAPSEPIILLALVDMHGFFNRYDPVTVYGLSYPYRLLFHHEFPSDS